MILMVEIGIRGRICKQFIGMQKLITNIWKIRIKKESSYFNYWKVNNVIIGM